MKKRRIMNKRFPQDCPVECIHLHQWGSIDNSIWACDVLNMQVKEKEMDFDWHSCPLPDDAIEVEYE